ncbi:MAG: hypothetical protein CEN90_523 [Parcubacteria group bacterium Licking1014_17]|nr:MAG: hypothetical protein CEN90_523 [Parcubacteria group bacterium Licking1014_17]
MSGFIEDMPGKSPEDDIRNEGLREIKGIIRENSDRGASIIREALTKFVAGGGTDKDLDKFMDDIREVFLDGMKRVDQSMKQHKIDKANLDFSSPEISEKDDE